MEHDALLPSDVKPAAVQEQRTSSASTRASRFSLLHLGAAFVAGIFACALGQYALHCGQQAPGVAAGSGQPGMLAAPWAGSTEVHGFPPVEPTNAVPSMFPSNVGYAGGTPTGAEPAVLATAPAVPIHKSTPNLAQPSVLKEASKSFNMFRSWGNLSPWYSVPRGAFGLDSGPEVPETCRITEAHILHRHGARYPTAWASYGGPANFSGRLHDVADKWNASGDLEFMNEWTYKLGEEILTPFGRQQLYDLGVQMRMRYGFLLKNFTESNTIPVFRTESQDRMLASAMNFAIGFFGWPTDGQYQQSITIEADGFNNTLAPYKTCPNAGDRSKSDRGTVYVEEWAAIYLKDAQARLSAQLHGYDLTIEDTYVLQQMCAYETVALGYSKFCELFTEEEWEGFDYALDLSFWYNSAFGSPVARVQGLGYVQELVARLTHTPIETYNSSTNATLNESPITFPLHDSLYVDATHEVVVLNVLTALNLSSLAANGPLPSDHIPKDRTFRVSQLAPFATNVQFQLLSCSSLPEPQIRIVVNDGAVPLTGVEGCPEEKDGMCPVSTFVAAQKKIIGETDWEYDCYGDWSVPAGSAWNTTTGDAPRW
ncbi:histidine phosphatase superfamily [Schizophyllum amplum]|uniref:Histidine phosphatase superfamily n=1 Tax=Schizophyllum amplum TaxID=97359 RepID=A0A550CGZ9_9AGAR|nr:histidine phosphatase superfamily [Auriculariopsis ampla]